MRGGVEIGRASSRGWENFGRSWTRWVQGLEDWSIFMDITCVSSVICIQLVHFFFFPPKRSNVVFACFFIYSKSTKLKLKVQYGHFDSFNDYHNPD